MKLIPLLLIGLVIAVVGSLIILSQPKSEKILGTTDQKPDYTLVFVGDSFTEYLGNFVELEEYLGKYYPGKKFLLLNYGFGSTSILNLQERVTQDSTHSGRIFMPINEIPFDLIFIESFGHNPLSHLPLEEGLLKQTAILDQTVATLSAKHPRSAIVFIATIAPNRERYGEGQVNLLPDKRAEWADERIAYIKNHIEYAQSHQIPLINIYEKSLDPKGSGYIDYISTQDFIHPSPTGIKFIQAQIAEFIWQEKLIK